MGDNQRRYHRLGVALEMRVSGNDATGLPFDEATSSDDVSRGGCSFQSVHEVQSGAQLELIIFRRAAGPRPATPFLTTGTVLRVIPLEPDQFKVCVQFTGPQFPTYTSESTGS